MPVGFRHTLTNGLRFEFQGCVRLPHGAGAAPPAPYLCPPVQQAPHLRGHLRHCRQPAAARPEPAGWAHALNSLSFAALPLQSCALCMPKVQRYQPTPWRYRRQNAILCSCFASPADVARGIWSAGVEDVRVVSEDGSPHGPRTFVLWNPPRLQAGRRAAGTGGHGETSFHTSAPTGCSSRGFVESSGRLCAFNQHV